MTSYGPKCPNHGCPLEGLPFPLPTKGTGRCAISGVAFDYEIEIDETSKKVDKNGNLIKDISWKVDGND